MSPIGSLQMQEMRAYNRVRRCQGALHGAARAALLSLLRLYQACVRPLLGGSCRFHPTCSEYAVEALTTHGVRSGLRLIVRRLLRCHPFGSWGFDPVPQRTGPPH